MKMRKAILALLLMVGVADASSVTCSGIIAHYGSPVNTDQCYGEAYVDCDEQFQVYHVIFEVYCGDSLPRTMDRYLEPGLHLLSMSNFDDHQAGGLVYAELWGVTAQGGDVLLDADITFPMHP